jgi:hypothetical protein
LNTPNPWSSALQGAAVGAGTGAQAGGGWGALIGGVVGGAGGYLSSDRRLKTNIVRVGTSSSGIPEYEFNYKDSAVKYHGAMADEVEKINPQAVIDMNGYKMVNYTMIDVRFGPV